MSLLLLVTEWPDIGPEDLIDAYVRRVENWELNYTLGGTAQFRCTVIDTRTDKENAYRPANDRYVLVRRLTGDPIFRGRIVQTTDGPLEEPNVGTKYQISCIGESEVFDSRFVTATFGSDPLPIFTSYNSVGGVTTVETLDLHGLSVGDEITFEGVTHATGVTSPVNGDRVVASVLNGYQFTVNVGTQIGDAYGGTVRRKMRLLRILQALENPYLTDYRYSLAPDIALGPLLEVQKFEDATINDIYRHLSKLTGWVHRFLPNRVVEWFEPGQKVSTAVFDKAATLGGTNWTQTRLKQANTVILKYGGTSPAPTVESISGNGVRREWPLVEKPVVNKPITSTSAQISLWVPEGDGGAMVARHVGVYGYDTLFEWLYRESDNTLVQQDNIQGTPIPIKPAGWVAYANLTAQRPGTVRVNDPVLVIAQGPREKIVQAPGIVDRNAALQLAAAELKGFTATPKEAKIVTELGLTWPGNSVEVQLPHIKMTGFFLILGVSIVETEVSLRYTYTCIEGNEYTTTWQERLRGLFGGGSTSSSSSVISGTISGGGGGGGGGGGTVLGTTGKIPVFTSATTVSDSVVTQSPDGNLVSTPAAIEATQGFRSNIFKGVTAGAVDAVFQNAAGQAVFEVPTGTRHAKFYGDVNTARVYADADLTLGAASNSVYPVGNYQTHLGGISRKWLTIHAAELYVEQLVAQETISTIGGSILVAPTTVLEADLPAAATTMVVKHNQMTLSDRVMLKSFGKFEVITINSNATGTGPYIYSVIRNLDGSGANDWFAGDAVVNTGKVGSGFIDIYAQRGTKSALEKGPTLVGNVRTNMGPVDWEPRWALGNLNGIYQYASDTYGFAAGVRTGAWIAVDPVSGVRIMNNNTVFAQITPSGSAFFTGVLTVVGSGSNVATIDLSNVTVIDGGKIQTNSLHANRIISGTITLSQLSFVPVTTGNVVATINASPEGIRISGSRIQIDGTVLFTSGYDPSTKIGAGGAASDINANVTTISGGKITTGTITADKLSVSSLSAITGNIGTITSGSISGATVTGGATTLDSSGLTMTAGSSTSNKIKWTNGGYILSNGNQIIFSNSGSELWWEGNILHHGGGNLGASSIRWANIFTSGADISGELRLVGDLRFTPSGTSSGDTPVVYSEGNGIFYRKTNCVTYSGGISGITVENGLVTGVS